MLYEAATGVLPQGAFAPPSRVNAAYGRAFDRIVMQLLQADPARRPSAAADVGRALSAALSPRRPRPLALAASGGRARLILAGGRVGLRALFRHDGKSEKQALAKIETTDAAKGDAGAGHAGTRHADSRAHRRIDEAARTRGRREGRPARARSEARSC